MFEHTITNYGILGFIVLLICGLCWLLGYFMGSCSILKEYEQLDIDDLEEYKRRRRQNLDRLTKKGKR